MSIYIIEAYQGKSLLNHVSLRAGAQEFLGSHLRQEMMGLAEYSRIEKEQSCEKPRVETVSGNYVEDSLF